MRFMEGQRSRGAVDERFETFIQTEAKKQQFQVSFADCYRYLFSVSSYRLCENIFNHVRETINMDCHIRHHEPATSDTEHINRLQFPM